MAENVTKDEIGRTPAFKHLSSEGRQPCSHGRVFASVALVVAAMSLNPVCAQATPANLLTNGSFEDTTNFVDNTGQDTMVLPVGSTAMPGWTVGSSAFVYWTGPVLPGCGVCSYYPSLLRAEDGSYFLNLSAPSGGGPPYGYVSQSIATSPGNTYQLSFYLGSSNQYGIQDGIVALVENSLSGGAFAEQTFTSTNGDVSPFNYWQLETMRFTARAVATTILLAGASGFDYVGLDNVSVSLISSPNPVPEPRSWTVLFPGLLGMAGLRLRRGAAHRPRARSRTGPGDGAETEFGCVAQPKPWRCSACRRKANKW